jgi:hypothetical protein
MDYSFGAPPVRIIVLGDSIAFGEWDSEGGWAQRLKVFLRVNFWQKKGQKFGFIISPFLDQQREISLKALTMR